MQLDGSNMHRIVREKGADCGPQARRRLKGGDGVVGPNAVVDRDGIVDRSGEHFRKEQEDGTDTRSWTERTARRLDLATAPLLRAYLRIWAMAVLFMLVFLPDRVSVITDLVKLIILSEPGLAIPIVALLAALPRPIEHLADMGDAE